MTFTNTLCEELQSLNLSMTDLKRTRNVHDLVVENKVVYIFLYTKTNHIGGVIVSLLGSIVVDYCSGPGQVKP